MESLLLAKGQEVEVVVLAVEPARRRISLSLRRALADALPPPRAPAVGDALEGRIAGVKPFGVFVDLPDYGPRASGLLPREQTGQARGADLAGAFKVGETLRVEVTAVKDGKIRLGLPRSAVPERARPADPGRPAPPAADQPLGTMALALRKAMEEARRRRERDQPS